MLADYSIDVTYLGRFTNTDDESFAVAEVTFTEDVEYAKVAIVSGAPTNAAINGILDGSIESIEIEESGTVQLPVESDGTYTIIAISFAGDEAQEVGYDTFNFSLGTSTIVNPANVTRSLINKISKENLINSIGNVR